MTSHSRSSYSRQIRNALTRTTAREPNPNALHRQCIVWGCGKPSQAFAGRGLSQRFCTSHVRHLARHGTVLRGSYRSAELKPYLWAAERWLKAHADDSIVRSIEAALAAMLEEAGRPEIATRLLRADAKRKARNALARMRVRQVSPRRLMTIVLATHALLVEDLSCSHRGHEFLHVQIARQAHRLAARFVPAGMEGRKSQPGAKLKWGNESFGYSAGGVLRELGRVLDETAGILADRGGTLASVIALKVEQFGPHPSRDSLARER